MPRLLLSAFVSLCVFLVVASLAAAQSNPNNTLAAATLYSFESPAAGGYAYNPPVTALQPWVWTPAQGGVATQGGPFDPPGVTTPPQNIQVRQTLHRPLPAPPLRFNSRPLQ